MASIDSPKIRSIGAEIIRFNDHSLSQIIFGVSLSNRYAGDKVVYYTDGIVEAMNKHEDMYGFERLHEVVKSSPAETAEALMNDIIRSVSDFTGAAPQHDDLTIIVVSAEK